MIPRPIHIHVLIDELPLKGVPIGVTSVSNSGSLKTSCISYMYASPTTNLWAEQKIIVVLRCRNTSLP
jgi:hypothetical protein